ncbi:MAG: hypothetical protein WB973_04895 [Thermoanaerobaculia bacterium]
MTKDDRQILRTLIYFRGMKLMKEARKVLKENKVERANARMQSA